MEIVQQLLQQSIDYAPIFGIVLISYIVLSKANSKREEQISRDYKHTLELMEKLHNQNREELKTLYEDIINKYKND